MKKIIDSFEEYVIAFLICGMIVFEAANALCNVLGVAIAGLPEELAIYCYIWIAFLSASFCAKKGCDVVVNILSNKYSDGIKKVLHLVNNALNLFLSVCLFIGAVGFVGQTAASGAVGKLSGIPLTIIYFAPVVGYLLCTVRNAVNVTASVKALKHEG